jgi:lysyl-tRNA synthetase class 2
VEERYRKRYIDLLINEEVREKALLRSKFISFLRNFLDNEGFVEVETPILQPVYGGASARPFITHHNALDSDFYLRISDELYLKRLIVGGFEKVYEIGKDFRNEGIDREHNPEFTQAEFYWAYVDYEFLANFVEKMLTEFIKQVKGGYVFEYQGKKLDFSPPWQRVNFFNLFLEKVGIDLNIVDTEEKLKKAVKEKELVFDDKGIVGYGALVDKLYKDFIRPTIIQPTFLFDYPAEMTALAKRKEEDPRKIASFQVLVSGFEIAKAYNELNDPIEQKERWEKMEDLAKKGLEEHETLDYDYIKALEYGMPPTAGCGLGIDRIVALLTDSANIKEVILFPTLRKKDDYETTST